MIYIAGVIDPDQGLSLFYSFYDEELAIAKAKELNEQYFQDHNDTGFVIVEKGELGKEMVRIRQYNLDDESWLWVDEDESPEIKGDEE